MRGLRDGNTLKVTHHFMRYMVMVLVDLCAYTSVILVCTCDIPVYHTCHRLLAIVQRLFWSSLRMATLDRTTKRVALYFMQPACKVLLHMSISCAYLHCPSLKCICKSRGKRLQASITNDYHLDAYTDRYCIERGISKMHIQMITIYTSQVRPSPSIVVPGWRWPSKRLLLCEALQLHHQVLHTLRLRSLKQLLTAPGDQLVKSW